MQFRSGPLLTFPIADKDAWFKEFFHLPDLPRLDMPDDLRFEEVIVRPKPRLLVQPCKNHWT